MLAMRKPLLHHLWHRGRSRTTGTSTEPTLLSADAPLSLLPLLNADPKLPPDISLAFLFSPQDSSCTRNPGVYTQFCLPVYIAHVTLHMSRCIWHTALTPHTSPRTCHTAHVTLHRYMHIIHSCKQHAMVAWCSVTMIKSPFKLRVQHQEFHQHT